MSTPTYIVRIGWKRTLNRRQVTVAPGIATSELEAAEYAAMLMGCGFTKPVTRYPTPFSTQFLSCDGLFASVSTIA